MVLTCPVEAEADTLKWEKDGVELAERRGKQLQLEHFSETEDSGYYSCFTGSSKAPHSFLYLRARGNPRLQHEPCRGVGRTGAEGPPMVSLTSQSPWGPGTSPVPHPGLSGATQLPRVLKYRSHPGPGLSAHCQAAPGLKRLPEPPRAVVGVRARAERGRTGGSARGRTGGSAAGLAPRREFLGSVCKEPQSSSAIMKRHKLRRTNTQ